MKRTLLVGIICLLNIATAQSQSDVYTDTRLFAQCMFSIENQDEIDALQNEIYQNPNIEMVRLDLISQRALIITANLEELSTEDFRSWFGKYEPSVSCIQIGVYGVDTMDSYPFVNCEN